MFAAEPALVRGLVLERLGEPPRLDSVQVAAPGPGEVRVRMKAAGLCHTDLASVRDARTTPLLLGHEGAGVIEAVGEGVEHLELGNPVLICWKLPCGSCRRCSAGQFELCESVVGLREPRFLWRGAAIAPFLNAGCFTELVVLPAAAAIPIEQDIPYELAAVVGCAVATGVGAVLRTAQVHAGASVAIWGTGGVGLNVLTASTLVGASVLVAVDPDEQRRAHALRRGATDAVDPEGAVEAILGATGGRGADFVFEVVGQPETVEQSLSALAPGGTLVLVGAARRDALVSFHPRAFMSNQQRILGCIYGSLRPLADLPLLLRWVAEGRLELDDLIAARITLDELTQAFEQPPAEGVRTVVVFD